MKNLVSAFIVLVLSGGLDAQVPQKFQYQAVVRDTEGSVIDDQVTGVQVSILQSSAEGAPVYVETFHPVTNGFGLIKLEIGNGSLVSGDFSSIDWGGHSYFLKIEIDASGGTNYTEMGTSQLLSVPYAQYANTAETLSGLLPETDPVYLSSEAANISAMDITKLANLAGVNTGDQDLSGLARQAALEDTAAAIRGDLPDVSGFLIAETDPVFGSSVVSGITGSDTANWNQKLDSFTESDPVYAGSPAASITSNDITDLGNLSGVNTGDQDLSGLATKTALGDTTNALRSIIPAYEVGDFAHGGVVFWVDESGQHGLVCVKADYDAPIRWYAGTYGNTQAKGDGPYAGEANTSIIFAAHVAIGDDGTTYAARVCNEYLITEGGYTYGDWYMPSKYELNLMYLNKASIEATSIANGGSAFGPGSFWSSTEYDHQLVYVQELGGGTGGPAFKIDPRNLRPVRAF